MISSLPTPEKLETLSTAIQAADLPIDLPEAAEARQDQTELLDQIHDYLLPRLKKIDAPLLTVLGGSTGAGKSTITNSLVGEEVTTAGVLRPTTRAPVLVCHPNDYAWFSDPNGVLPGHARSTDAESAGTTGLRLVTSQKLPVGLGILDAPDIDSIEVANHDLATQLLGAADLWLFVTTAARYADAVPWEYLATARERSTALAVLINRIPSGHEEEVVGHFSEMLASHGLGGAPVFSVTETDLTDDRLDVEISHVRSWLHNLTADSANRQSLVRSTLVGTLASIPQRVQRIGDALDAQADHLATLRQIAVERYSQAMDDIDTELNRGTLLRGEVLEQWREFVGTGALMSKLESGVGRLRDRAKKLFRSGASPDAAAAGQLESNLLIVTRDAIDRAALDVVEQWDTRIGGKQLLEQAPRGIDRASADSGPRIELELRAWEQEVLDLVRAEAGDKVAVARTVSTGINGVGVALMVAVFSQSAGITGMEAAIATGTAAVSQTVLTAVFGEQAVRELASKARDRLDARLRHLLDVDRGRFDSMTSTQNVSSNDLFDALYSLGDPNREH